MSIQLPAALAVYVKAENSGDVGLLAECFAPEATVRDEGRTYRGLPAIREWKAATKTKYNHTVTPLKVTRRNAATVMKARLDGDFPGSPVTLEFRFMLDAGKIASLEIGV
jgi:SnoaL-like domain